MASEKNGKKPSYTFCVGDIVIPTTWMMPALFVPCLLRGSERRVKHVTKHIVTLDDGSTWKQGSGQRIRGKTDDSTGTWSYIRPKAVCEQVDQHVKALTRVHSTKWDNVGRSKLLRIVAVLDEPEER